MRRPATFVAVVAALLSLVACAPAERVDLGQSSGNLIAAIGGEPDQLDPQKTSAYFSFEVLENVFDTLVEPDANLTMRPALAESWTVSSDQLQWTFRLRRGVTFHDGSPFTADDVVYSYRRIIDEKLSNVDKFAAVTDVRAAGPDTVVIRVKQPTPNLLTNLGGFKGMAIVSRRNVESGQIATHPVGTGPFSFVSQRSGDSITLAANPSYWGGAPAIPGVTFQFISEPSTALSALQAGEIDWTDSIPTQRVDQLRDDESIHLAVTPSNDYWYLALNEARPPWNDVRVRQAIAYAIDRDAIVRVTSQVGVSVPDFWMGILLIALFATTLGWLPTSGYRPLFGDPLGWLSHILLPAVVVGLVAGAIMTRYVRSAVLDVAGAGYVRTARSKGLPPAVVTFRHTVRNALVPILTITGIQLATVLGGVIVVEVVFAWPGLGRLVYNAVAARDYPVIQGAVLLIAALFLLINLIVDVLYAVVDPRIRLS